MKADISCNVLETRFENGLTVLTDHMEGVRSATLSFLYRVGARCESAEWHGVSHFIEHAVFKGTRRRSTADIAIDRIDLAEILDASHNARRNGLCDEGRR
ncbi:MAG: insulinase family protein [Pyrinomonadaceae bacterium]